jgi:hypothetical protein
MQSGLSVMAAIWWAGVFQSVVAAQQRNMSFEPATFTNTSPVFLRIVKSQQVKGVEDDASFF